MLEYFKTILSKVAFDEQLFEKELRKALSMLVANEVEELKSWCHQRFGHLQPVLNRCFSTVKVSY